MTRPILEARDLHTTFTATGLWSGQGAQRGRLRAVDGVNLQVSSGELVALVGESGCGKTTTAQTILRLIEAESGSVIIDGEDVTQMSQRRLKRLRRRMQLIYQDPYESLDPRFRVRQTMEEPLLIHKVSRSRADRSRRVNEALQTVGLTPPELYLDRYPHELSGGQRQRVAIAAALVLEPEILVADEPVSMLDVSVRAGVLRLIDDLRRDRGMAVLMITHDLSTAAQFADRIAVMYLGRIVEQGPAREVIRDPRHPYTRALLSVVPPRDPRQRRAPQILQGEPPDARDVPPGCRFHPRCPLAIPACSHSEPDLAASGGEGHEVACLRADEAAPLSGARPEGSGS